MVMERLTRRGSAATNVPAAFFAGVLITLAETLLHPLILLVYFVSQLTSSLQSVAMVIVVGFGAWALPQIVWPWLYRATSRQLPWALSAMTVRTAAAILLAYTAYRTGVSDEQRLRAFFICYLAYSLSAGIAHVPVTMLLARGVPSSARGRLVQQQVLWAGIAAVVAAVVVRETLGPTGPGFPRHLALVFVAAATSLIAATYFVARIREPRVAQSSEAVVAPPRRRDFGQALSDGAFRRFVLFGTLAALSSLADPFYLLYARQQVALPDSWVGLALLFYATGSLLSGPLWSAIVNTSGAKAVVQTATAVKIISPLTLVAVPHVLSSQLYVDHVTNSDVAQWMLALPFAAIGVATRGLLTGNFAYLADLKVASRQSAYHFLALTPLLVAAVAPLAGASLAGRWGLDRLLMIALSAGLVSVLGTGMLANTSRRVRGTRSAWRLREARP
jgi:hypothetical protein